MLINKATQDAIWDWDLTTNEVIWNEAVLTVFGYHAEDVALTASWWYEHIHPDDRDAVVHGIHDVIDAGGSSWSDEYRFKCRNGEYKVVYDRGFLIHDSQGKSIRMLGSMQDITERKRFEKSLKESEERFRAMADNIPNLAWMADADGWIFWYNKKWYDYTGTTASDMEGWGWQSVHDPDALPGVMQKWKSSIETGEPFDMVFPLKGADGIFRPFLTRVLPVRNEQGKIARWFGTNTDVAKQIKTEEALRESSEKFRSLLESLPQITWTNSPSGEINFFNQKWFDYTGLTLENSQDWKWVTAIHEDDRNDTVTKLPKGIQRRHQPSRRDQAKASGWQFIIGTSSKPCQ